VTGKAIVAALLTLVSLSGGVCLALLISGLVAGIQLLPSSAIAADAKYGPKATVRPEKLFEYDKKAPIDIKQAGVRREGGRQGLRHHVRQPEGRPRSRLPGRAPRKGSVRRRALHALGNHRSRRISTRSAAICQGRSNIPAA
jgi:hypothetical protein